MGIPLFKGREELESVIQNINITLYHAENEKELAIGNISVNEENLEVQTDHFEKISPMVRIALLYHEFTHLDSPLMEYYNTNQDQILEKADELLSKKGDLHVSKYDVCMGIVAIEEVLAQWLAERTTVQKETAKKMYNVNILGNDIECESDFELDEVYIPLQQYVEMFISEMGHESIESFARDLYGRQINCEDLVTAENISMLGNVGKMCKGVYKENEFWDSGILSEEIKEAVEYFDSKDKKTKGIVKPVDVVEAEKDRKLSKTIIDKISNFFNQLIEKLKGTDAR